MRKMLQQVALVVGAASVLVPTAAHAGDDNWPCEVVLCMANPNGPTALKECEPPIKRAWKAWSKGKRIPSCKRSDGSELSSNEGALNQQEAEPLKNCPMTYVATRKKTAYCAFSGVTEQWIDGELWGRIWYGGPTEEPYIEHLKEDPNNPRPTQPIVDAWPGMKADIEAKAEAAAQAYKAWEEAEQESLQAQAQAMLATQQATKYAKELATLEANLPGTIESTIAQIAYYDAELATLQAKLPAAEAAAKAPGASAADLAAYEQAKALVFAYQHIVQNTRNNLASLQATQAQLPQMRQKAAELAAVAANAQSVADQKKQVAQSRKAASDAAEAAAQPLPKYYGTGGTDGL